MQSPVCSSSRLFNFSFKSLSCTAFHWFILLIASVLFSATIFAAPALSAQRLNRITQPIDTSSAQPLPNHHPLWASPANAIGSVPANLPLDQLTLVLSRSPEQEAAFQQFLADQQNPGSPNYHHWLTPDEVGQRFGLSDQDIASITGWLQSQGLHVNWVSPSRIFIGFGGTAADVGSAFQTEVRYYQVNGVQRLSVSSDPLVPSAVAPVIKAIRGLYSIDEQPNHYVTTVQSTSPQLTSSLGNHYITPADFNRIYDVPSSLTGAGVTIGIVDRSRTNFADFSNFRSLTGSAFPNPTEIVPTAFGGVDPGPAYTAPPGGSISTNEQGEATLDVLRAGSVAPGANLLLVVASSASGGIGADAQYLVHTSPVPAQVMSISFGACESAAGPSNVNYWDGLFQIAASEGISVFVSSGDSGAAGCDSAFTAPPASPKANSPNYLCSSSYVTCVGGTEFADTASPSTYWSSSNSAGYLSALSYIPEGAWNESTATSVAGTGGGVSTVIATPAWQTGTGVPSPGTGRYMPDVSFSASGHDAYFACMAANNGSCVGSPFSFIGFAGTSASAPGMAGVAALLDQKLGTPQGNLNPRLYPLAASVPTAFHDTTTSSSGVSGCSVNAASLCNNSVASTSGAAQAGFLLNTGYDEATGLGSLDVNVFLNSYSTGAAAPTATTGTATTIATTSATLSGTVNPNGLGTQAWFLYGTSSTLSGASQTTPQGLGSGTTITTASANISSLTADTQYYFQLVAQSSAGTSSGAIQSFTTSSVTRTTPTITWATPAAINYGTALSPAQLNATASIPGTFVYSPAAGTVLTAGPQLLSVNFTPTDTTTYNTASGTVNLTVNKVTPNITWANPAAITYGTALSATQLNATASVAGSISYLPVLGTVPTAGLHILTANFTPTDSTDYNATSRGVTLTVIKATPTIMWNTPSAVVVGTALSATQLNATATVPGTFFYTPTLGTLMSAIGSTTLSTTFTPIDSNNNNPVSASATLNVTPFAVLGTAVSNLTAGATTGNTSAITVTPGAGFSGSVALTATITASPSGAINTPTLTFATNPLTITTTTPVITMLTVATTASKTTSCSAVNQTPRGIPWYAQGGAVLACLLLFGFAPTQRKWRTTLGALMLLIALTGGLMACGGSKGSPCTSTTVPGTTAGSYTITVTATSGATTLTSAPIALTVQ